MLVGVGSTAEPSSKHRGQRVTGTFLRLYEASVSHAHAHTLSTPNAQHPLTSYASSHVVAGSLEI